MAKQISHEDKIITEFLEAIGPWRETLIIGGGFAPFVYKLYLAGPQAEHEPVATHDLDVLLPRNLPKTRFRDILDYLQEAGFELIHKDREHPPTCSYVKEIDGEELEVEFLTSLSRQRSNTIIQGVIAQPLSYLDISLTHTITFHTHLKQTGLVVSPEAWMFHKGLTFTKRPNVSKKLKDLYGIWYVATELGAFSTHAREKLMILKRRYDKWNETFEKNLKNWIHQASPLLWQQLEGQDPSGRLKKQHFEQMILGLL